MMGEYIDTVEEGVTLSAFTNEVTAWLQQCFDLLEAGQEDRIPSDPWYTRATGRPILTDYLVDGMILALDAEYDMEIGTYPGYHRNRSGANARTGFDRLAPRARRALVEGLDRIVTKHTAAGTGPPPATTSYAGADIGQ